MKIVNISVLAALLLFSQCSGTKKSAKSNTPPPPPGQSASKKASIKDKTKNCRKIEGLFTIYSDTTTGDAYMVVKKDQLDKEFIYFSYAENGLVMTGHFRGAYRDNMVFRMKKVFDRVEFVKENTHFYFDPNNALSKAAEANISNSILLSEKIVAEDTASGEYLLDANSIFLSEKLTRIKPNLPPSPMAAMMFNLGMLSKDKTKYGNLRSYPENTDVVVEYVYDNPSPINNGGTEVADARSVTLKIQHSFIEAPENDFEPRMDDPRIGYFTQQINDMTTPDATNYRDPIHRWHLVKKDPTAALSEPVEPIVWWIENTTPVEYRETIKKAGETWNRAFEKIGFKNAVKVEVQPDTASWDAGDIRYNVLRWTSSPTPPFGGYGPSFVNPRTGQILGADIMLEYIYVTNRMRQEKLFSTAGLEHLLLSGEELEFPVNGNYCDAGMHMHHNTMFGLCGMMAMDASQEKKDEFLHQSLYYLVLHEMGHTLGLNHNMKS
ncbi:MAG TPA: DUF5117 domain-containing protein, partial [Bacteroidia bacterium]|nr:DUF5117 domain-containing protein [Bacteroidia bacterium]